MTDSGRPRPSYGLPGPTPPPSAEQGPADAAGSSSPASSWGEPQSASPAHAQGSVHPSTEPPASTWGSPSPGGQQPAGASQKQPSRRRGLRPLITGLVLMLLFAPGLTIGGILWGMGALIADAGSGPTVLQGGSGSVEAPANHLLVVYVPAEDAAATCTAEAPSTSGGSSLTVVPSSAETTFGDGTRYVQKLGVLAMEDTTVTISCQGTDTPAYLGPYSLWGMMLPLIIGPVLGTLLGLIGLILVIVGIVKLIRSRRA